MSRGLRVVPVVLLAVALGGCTAAASTTSTGPSGVAAASEAGSDVAGSDVGNGRPTVTNDGLMVRRRVVVAIRASPGADLDSLRKEVDAVAARSHASLSTLPPDVLDPALLERLAPDLVLALPAGETISDASRLFDPASSGGRKLAEVAELAVAPVLVHDLRFTVSAANPPGLAAAIAREGILSDALGSYTATPGRGELSLAYTGPLLSDDLVGLVRAGIARRAGVQPSAVKVSPRATTGTGVDMAREPPPAPATTEAAPSHHHGAALPPVRAASLSVGPLTSSVRPPASSRSSTLWAVSAVALPLLLVLTLVLLLLRRGTTFSGPERVAEGNAEEG